MEQYISIPKPCHEDWDKMNPNQEGKFCNSCSKTVVDFTKMSKEEIHTYFKQKSGENTCGHFYASQLEEDKKVKPIVLKRMNYFATILLGLFLPLSSCKKQVTGEPSVIEDEKMETELKGDTVFTGSDQKIPPVVEYKSNSQSKKGKVQIVNGMTLYKIDTLVDGKVEVKDK
jgi:hypothetical protein